MDKSTAVLVLKSINRHIRRRRIFDGGRTFGVDYATWRGSFPHLSSVANDCGEAINGRRGRYLPIALLG